MSMIRIEEIVKADGSVEIKVDGVLNRKSLVLLDKVCRLYLSNDRKIVLNLNGMIHITTLDQFRVFEIPGANRQHIFFCLNAKYKRTLCR